MQPRRRANGFVFALALLTLVSFALAANITVSVQRPAHECSRRWDPTELVATPCPVCDAFEEPVWGDVGITLGGTDQVWSAFPAPTTQPDRLVHATTWDPVEDMVYMTGGNASGTTAQFDNHQRLNPNTNVWTDRAPLPAPLGWTSGGWIRGKLYIASGYTSAGSASNACYEYTPGTNTWATRATMNRSTVAAQQAVWRDSILFVIGGTTSGLGSPEYGVSLYNPWTNTWRAGVPIPTHADMGSCVIVDDTIWVTNTYNRASTATYAMKGAINPTNCSLITWTTWTAASQEPRGLRFNGASAKAGQWVYCWGGYTGTAFPPRRTGWRYNVSTQVFESIPWWPRVGGVTRCQFGVGREATNEVFTVAGDSGGDWATPNRVYARIQFTPPNDVGVDRMYVPAGFDADSGVAFEPLIRVRNFGLNQATNFPVGFEIDSGGALIYQEVTLIGSLAPGDTTQVLFPEVTLHPNLWTCYKVYGFTAWTPDPVKGNDTLRKMMIRSIDTLSSFSGARAPTIDGYLDFGGNEWDDASYANVSNVQSGRGPRSAEIWHKHDNSYMYFAVAYPQGPSRSNGDQFGLYVDEDNNKAWHPAGMEGNYWIWVTGTGADQVLFRPITPSGPGEPQVCPGASSASSTFNGYLCFEARVPIGTLPYQVNVRSSDDTCGYWLYAQDDGAMQGWWPASFPALGDTWLRPEFFGTLRLLTLQTGDVGVASIEAPTGRVPPGNTVTPRATWRNFGTTPMNFTAYCFLHDPDGNRFYDESQNSQLEGGQSVQLTFPVSGALTTEGGYVVKCSTAAAGDVNPANDWRQVPFAVGLAADMQVTAIVAPTGVVDTMAIVQPKARIKVNNALSAINAAIFFIITSPDDTVRYNEMVDWLGATQGEDSVFTFPDFGPVPNIPGRWSVLCSLYCAPDTFAANDKKSGAFFVGQGPGVVYAFKGNKTNEFWLYNQDVPSWTEKAAATLGSKPIAAGGFLTYNASDQRIYAGKGNKTNDFLRYNIMGDSWALLKPIPGTKPTAKGTVGRSDGASNVYVVLGNNTSEFYRYNAEADSWKTLSEVPPGASTKKVKAGSNLAWHPGEPGRLYFLKGGKSDFMAYRPDGDSWAQLANAPGDKFPAGSWLASDGDSLVYCHQGKVGAMNIYNTKTGAWSAAPGGGIPLTGRSGKSKKPKDGSAGAFLDGKLYALKGGNTEELWVYAADSGKWTQLDDVPL
ncbi:hypothetical protein FJY69_02100, partial [candidate division WOR-3 bacterium]|nr:hypothetical protein [candidate division WOR-3 bacterium]